MMRLAALGLIFGLLAAQASAADITGGLGPGTPSCSVANCSITGPMTLGSTLSATHGGTLGGTFGGSWTASGTVTLSGSVTASAGLTTTGSALAANFTNFGRGNTYALSGSTIDTTKMGLFVNNNASGTTTASEVPTLGYFSASSVNVNAATSLIDGVDMVMNAGGAAAASAGWNALSISLNDSAATNDKSGGGTGAFVSLQIARRASFNQGGTGLTPSTAFGQNWGLDIVSSTLSGATDIALNNGLEVDLSQQTGSSVMRSAGIQIGHTNSHAVQSSMWDYGLLIAQATNTAPFLELLGFGGGTSVRSPLGSTGTVMGYHVAQDGNAPANRGVDFRDVSFTTASLDLPGFQVSGSGTALGTTRIGSMYVTPTSSGESLDAIGSVATAMAISAGGSGYTDGVNTVVDDQCGGVELVTSASGIVTTVVSVIRQPVCNSLSPPATLTTTARAPSGGTGLVLTPTWDSTRTALKLNPSAGGEIIVGSGNNVSSLSVTKGFFHFPYTNATSGAGGIPTGTPAAIQGDACIWNDVTFTINCYSGSAGAWKHITFSSGAG